MYVTLDNLPSFRVDLYTAIPLRSDEEVKNMLLVPSTAEAAILFTVLDSIQYR